MTTAMPDARLKVGIVSANWGALAHLPPGDCSATRLRSPRFARRAAKRPRLLAAQFNVARPFWNYEDLCTDPAIDVIDAGSSPLLREKIIAAALANGKHWH